MKLRHFVKYISSFVLATCLLCSVAFPAKASTMRASDYFDFTLAYIDTKPNGNLSIHFSVGSLSFMDKLGATTIHLYEDSGNGFKRIKTFSSDDRNYSYIMSSNATICNKTVPYMGTVGNDYYAVIYVYAEDQYGSDTDSVTTSVVTAS